MTTAMNRQHTGRRFEGRTSRKNVVGMLLCQANLSRIGEYRCPPVAGRLDGGASLFVVPALQQLASVVMRQEYASARLHRGQRRMQIAGDARE